MNFDREQFEEAVRLWTEWNGKINVVSRKDVDCLFEHHILHSLAIAEYLHRFYNYPIISSAVADAVPESSGESLQRNSARFARSGPSQNLLRPASQNSYLPGPTPCPCPGSRGCSQQAYICLRPEQKGLPAGTDRPAEGNSPAAPSQLPLGKEIRILDVGCGGGFPGIPLAMVMPEARFTLCDSIGKKVMVAQAVADGLGLENVECVNARVETLPGRWDWVVSRAVTSLDNFYPWVKGRFTKGILYLKGGDVAAEIAQMCSRCKVDPSKVTAWPISSWLEDDYFAEKFVIEIRKA